MPDYLPNQSRLLHGAFMEVSLSVPPLFVEFQFNPERITRARQSYEVASDTGGQPSNESSQVKQLRGEVLTRCQAQRADNLHALGKSQERVVEQESISFDLRLDAKADPIMTTAKRGQNQSDLEKFVEKSESLSRSIGSFAGILPQLSALELMTIPSADDLVNQFLSKFKATGWAFSDRAKPPIVLFIWGHKRVLPVNITNLNIVEEEFAPDLTPIRATVSVSLKLIEERSHYQYYTRLLREVSATANLAKMAPGIRNVILPR